MTTTAPSAPPVPAHAGEPLAVRALDWLLAVARPGDGGSLYWTTRPSDDEPNPTLYTGTSGVVMALLEAWRHFGGGTDGAAVDGAAARVAAAEGAAATAAATKSAGSFGAPARGAVAEGTGSGTNPERYADAALRAARGLAGCLDGLEGSSLYFGVMGAALALRTVQRELGDTASGAAADRALDLVRSRFDGTRWDIRFELMGGNAGIALGALLCGEPELAQLAVGPYLRLAEPTAHGVQWEQRQETEARLHHVSHGTLGITLAVASVGHATGRRDLLDLAAAGAADVVARNEAGRQGFLVPHSDPQHRPDLIDRHSYGWCHGPAGDAQAFRLLGHVYGDPVWDALGERCWHTVLGSGLPQRLRPGFWDNSGRCCGTAGVLALALDRAEAERYGTAGDGAGAVPPAGSGAGARAGAAARPGAGAGDAGGSGRAHWRTGLGFADILVADMTRRATVDRTGARWSNTEHRATPSALEPEPGWAMGNAGIVRELLRHARLHTGREPGYFVQWPDQPPVRYEAAPAAR